MQRGGACHFEAETVAPSNRESRVADIQVADLDGDARVGGELVHIHRRVVVDYDIHAEAALVSENLGAVGTAVVETEIRRAAEQRKVSGSCASEAPEGVGILHGESTAVDRRASGKGVVARVRRGAGDRAEGEGASTALDELQGTARTIAEHAVIGRILETKHGKGGRPGAGHVGNRRLTSGESAERSAIANVQNGTVCKLKVASERRCSRSSELHCALLHGESLLEGIGRVGEYQAAGTELGEVRRSDGATDRGRRATRVAAADIDQPFAKSRCRRHTGAVGPQDKVAEGQIGTDDRSRAARAIDEDTAFIRAADCCRADNAQGAAADVLCRAEGIDVVRAGERLGGRDVSDRGQLSSRKTGDRHPGIGRNAIGSIGDKVGVVGGVRRHNARGIDAIDDGSRSCGA